MHHIGVEIVCRDQSSGLLEYHRKGTHGVRANGVTADFMFFDRGFVGVLPLIYLHLPRSARVYLFPQSVKLPYVCSSPVGVAPRLRYEERGSWSQACGEDGQYIYIYIYIYIYVLGVYVL